ncbi:hypothetical protein Tco_0145907 [Tanacetum coccineum]
MKMEILLEPTSNKLLVDLLIKRTGKYGDSDGYTLDDPILILEILSRRFFLRGIYLITGRSSQIRRGYVTGINVTGMGLEQAILFSRRCHVRVVPGIGLVRLAIFQARARRVLCESGLHNLSNKEILPPKFNDHSQGYKGLLIHDFLCLELYTYQELP